MSTKELDLLEALQKVREKRMCLDSLDNQVKKKQELSCLWERLKSNY